MPLNPLTRARKTLRKLGPGLVTGASDDDPSGIGTYAQAGAQFGYGLLWTLLFSYPLMLAIQLIAARVGCATGEGLAANLRRQVPAWLLVPLILLLLVANVINLGADLSAMGAAIQLLAGGPAPLYTAALGLASMLAQVFVPYSRYASVLKWLTLALLSYVAVVFAVEVPWREVALRTLLPSFAFDGATWMMIVAIFGTTISPYLFFWQASQEVEETERHDTRQPLLEAPEQGRKQLARIRLDTWIGMGLSNLVAFFIIVSTAATLHRQGVTEIESAAQAAKALEPAAGALASWLFALGIVGTGLLAIPVLAGSAAYAVGELMKWPVGLEKKPLQAKGFYGVLAASIALGVAIGCADLNPMKALYWSAVINGVIAVPIMAILVWLASRSKVMGDFAAGGLLKAMGWICTLVMAAAVALMAGHEWMS